MSEPRSSGRRIGEEPKPRVLFSWDGPTREQVAEVLGLHAPTIRIIDALDGIRQDDYDILVTNRMGELVGRHRVPIARTGAEEHLFVVSFGPHPSERAEAHRGAADFCRFKGRSYEIEWEMDFPSKAVEVPLELLAAATDLVNDDLVPTTQSRESHIYFRAGRPLVSGLPPEGSSTSEPRLPAPAFVLHAFLWTSGRDSKVLAGWYRRSESSEGWVLPSDVRRPWDWVAAAIRHWAITYGRFPLVGGWWEDPRWQTSAETRAMATRAKLIQDLAEVSARLQEGIAAATADLEKAQHDAAGGRRRLLTDKGDSLKDATLEAFRCLGYGVIDRDQEQPHDTGGRIEDLGVVDPDDAALDPIVEVKGYDRGAKAGDAYKMARHMTRAVASGRSPSAIWWVINHRRTQSPAERGLVLAGEEALTANDADEDVPLVLIDTVELFRALRAVDEGQLTRDQVRASLRAAKGRWGIDGLDG